MKVQQSDPALNSGENRTPDPSATKLERFNYFCDFFVCPPLAGFLLYNCWRDLPILPPGRAAFGVALFFLGGLLAWTLIEYSVHRWLFHGAPVLRQLHGAHHAAPQLLIGSPPGSLPLALAMIGYAALYDVNAAAAAGVTAGLVGGYLFYCSVHYATHQLRSGHPGYLDFARRHHMLHHFRAGEDVNFGVTTDVWDRAFGTLFKPEIRRPAQ